MEEGPALRTRAIIGLISLIRPIGTYKADRTYAVGPHRALSTHAMTMSLPRMWTLVAAGSKGSFSSFSMGLILEVKVLVIICGAVTPSTISFSALKLMNLPCD